MNNLRKCQVYGNLRLYLDHELDLVHIFDGITPMVEQFVVGGDQLVDQVLHGLDARLKLFSSEICVQATFQFFSLSLYRK